MRDHGTPSPLVIPSATWTKRQLLAAAERLFAEKGIHQSSIRQITEAAGTSTDAVNYHFGSKRGLIIAVLESRTSQLSDAVNSELGQRATGTPITAEQVARAAVLPAIDMAGTESGRYYHAFLGSLLAEKDLASEVLRPAASPQFGALLRALREARPELTDGQAAQRLTLALDLVLHAVGSTTVASWLSEALEHDGDDLTTVLLTTVTAVLSA